MRKLGVFVLGATLAFAASFSINNTISANAVEIEKRVYVGGMSAGFTLKTGGAQVIGISEVLSDGASSSPAGKAGVRTGDIIYKVENIRVESIEDLNEIVGKCKGKPLKFEIFRGEERLNIEIQPIKEKTTGKYKIGVLIRDSVSGIGTVTYIDKASGRFGSLGHSVAGENQTQLQLYEGTVYECSIVGINKGVRGKAGELRGMFLSDKHLGQAEKLCECGIFGQISSDFVVDELMSAVASSCEAKPGKAYIYSTINGVEPKRYEIEIVKVDKGNRDNKNYVLKITDEELIAETGGIVQGMSGSPILQGDKLIGAVTHVFLNDPTRGYGIDIGRMLDK